MSASEDSRYRRASEKKRQIDGGSKHVGDNNALLQITTTGAVVDTNFTHRWLARSHLTYASLRGSAQVVR